MPGGTSPAPRPLLTRVQPQLVAGQRLQRQLVSLELGVQQQPLGPQRAVRRARHPAPPPARGERAAASAQHHGNRGRGRPAPGVHAGSRSPGPGAATGPRRAGSCSRRARTTLPGGARAQERWGGGASCRRLRLLLVLHGAAGLRRAVSGERGANRARPAPACPAPLPRSGAPLGRPSAGGGGREGRAGLGCGEAAPGEGGPRPVREGRAR